MPLPDQLSERELRVLEAVVQTYIETAEPAGSQTIARRFGLGVSPATIRNTMSELEDKGYPLSSAYLRRADPDRPGLPGVCGRDHAAVSPEPRAAAHPARRAGGQPQCGGRDSPAGRPGARGADPGAGRGGGARLWIRW